MMEGVSRYKECVRRRRSCDGSSVPVSSLSRIVAESQRLRGEETRTKEELESFLEQSRSIQRKVDKSLSRLKRLR